MSILLTVVLCILWLAVAFFCARLLGRRFLREPRDADIAASGFAVALAVGTLLPFPLRYAAVPQGVSAQPTPTAAPPMGAVLAWPPPGRDRSAACRSVEGRLPAGGTGSIDDLRTAVDGVFIDDGGTLNDRSEYYLTGWAVQPGLRAPASAVCLVVDERVIPRATVYYGEERTDVALALKNARLVPSGFVIKIPRRAMGDGKHQLTVAVRALSGSFVTIGTGRTVIVSH